MWNLTIRRSYDLVGRVAGKGKGKKLPFLRIHLSEIRGEIRSQKRAKKCIFSLLFAENFDHAHLGSLLAVNER